MNDLVKLRNEIVNLGLSAEIIGNWLWVGGNTYPLKDKLNSLGFRFSKNKQQWYITFIPYKKKTNKQFTIDELREIYNKSQLILK